MVEFNKTVLDNGLTVIHEKRDVDVTTVMMSVKFGAMYESKEEKGIAHFMEHLCFKGTDKRNTHEISAALEKVGGDLNAFTHEEMTAYHVKLPSNHMELGIDVISDIFFNPIFPEEEVEKEANVICEEIKMYRDNPRAHVLELLKNGLYEEPFGMFTAGTEEIVKSITRDDIMKKHRDIYIPQNSVLCVVGNNSFDDVVKFAKEYAGVKREGTVLADNLDVKKKLKNSEESRADVMQSNVAIGLHLPIKNKQDEFTTLLFNAILGDGMSSKLFSEVREKRGLVYTVKSDSDIGRNYSYMIIFAGTDPKKVDEVIKVSLEQFRNMKDITNEELEEAKIQVIGNHVVSSEGSNETAVNLIMEEFSGDAKEYYDFAKRVNSVTLEDIKKMAEISDFVTSHIGPKN